MNCVKEVKSDNVFADSFVREVNLDLQEIKKNFFKIGFRLDEAKRFGYFRNLGFDTIEACAEALFGFKKSTTYNLINVYRTFNENGTYFLPERWANFSQSQLVEMQNCPVLQKLATPETTIDDMKYFKKLLSRCNGYYSSCIKSLPEYIEKLEKIVADDFKKDLEKATTTIQKNEIKVEKQVEITEPVKSIELKEEIKPQIKEVKEVEEVKDVEFFQTSGKIEEKVELEKIDFEKLNLLGKVKVDRDFIKKNRTKVKRQLVDYLFDKLGAFDYVLSLNGRKQGLKVFFGIIVDLLLDELFTL